MKKKIILGDISVINEKGADYLLDNYYWPVSDDEFKDFIRYTHDEYLKIVNSLENRDLYNIAIVELSFIAKLQQILHYNYVKNYSSNNNIELVTSKLSNEFYYPDWESISRYYSSLNPTFSKLKRLFRRVAKNILFNRHISIINCIKIFMRGSSVIGVGSYDNLKKEFVIKKNLFCDHLDSADLYSNKRVDGDDQFDNIKISLEHEVITPYFEKLKRSNKNFIGNIDLTLVQNAWRRRFVDATCIYLNIKKNKKKSILLVTELSKPIHKLITVAYQEAGCSVYCFHHGHDTAVTTHSIGHDITSAHCLRYVVPSDGIISKYKKVYPHIRTKYFSTESSWYKHESQKYHYKPNCKIKSVMLIGFPFNSLRYLDGEGSFFYSRVDLELRLIKFLKIHDYYVIYKSHPDRLSEAAGLYDHIADEIITSPFERTVCMADCFLFTHSSSTTFGYALLMNKPIFLIDIDSSVVDIDSYNLLKKRVEMIPSHVGESTRIFFDKNNMLKKLSKPTLDNYDNSYIKKMFFPVDDS